jgi:predicted enzyme related to lactoylglutathione lyase
MASPHGSFVWYELMTTDAAAAETFYKSVIGWNAQDAGYPDFRYTLLSVGETQVAGLMTLPKEASDAGAKPGWMGYVAVDDVDDYAARFTKAGGTVHRAPADIPDIGRFAVVADPQGAVIVLFKGTGTSPPASANTPGHPGWRELYAADGAAAFAFYSGMFGWTKGDAVDIGPMGTYQLFAIAGGGEPIGGIMTKPPNIPAPFWTYYFQVDGIAAAVARITAAGGTIINGPMEVPGGSWIVQALDPQGAMFALVSAKA